MKFKVSPKYSLLLVMLYCIAFTISGSTNHTADYSQFEDNKQEDRVSAISGNDFIHIAEFNSTFSFSDENLPENDYELSQDFTSRLALFQNYLNSSFQSYESKAVNLLIRKRQSDITYPYHSFW